MVRKVEGRWPLDFLIDIVGKEMNIVFFSFNILKFVICRMIYLVDGHYAKAGLFTMLKNG